MDDATRVWNRATTGAAPTGPGDRALHDVFVVHGDVMNGGLLSALDHVEYDDLGRAADGLDRLGFMGAAAALREARRLAFPDGPVAADERETHTMNLAATVLERIEGELEDAYDVSDAALYDAFLRWFRERRGDFAP